MQPRTEIHRGQAAIVALQDTVERLIGALTEGGSLTANAADDLRASLVGPAGRGGRQFDFSEDIEAYWL